VSNFFIFGCSRSGTTLLASMLNAHPEIIVPTETWWFSIARELGLSSFASKILTSEFLRILGKNIEQAHDEQWNKFFVRFAKGNRSFKGRYDELFRIFSEAVKVEFGAKHFGEKTPCHTTFMIEVYDKFPDFKKIILLRDPRDIVCSYFTSLVDKSAGSLCEVLVILKDYMLHMAYAMRNKPCLIVRYEELTENPELELVKLCAGLNIEFSPKMLDLKAVTNPVGIHGNLNKKTFINSGAYVSQLSYEELLSIEYVLASEMELFGYRPVNGKLESLPEFLVDILREVELKKNSDILKKCSDNWHVTWDVRVRAILNQLGAAWIVSK
jgi:hypothetical protein